MPTRTTRRRVLAGLASLAGATVCLGGYALAIEPRWRLGITRYRLLPQGWPAGLKLRLAVIADLHAGEPVMPAARIEEIVARTNALGADIVLLLGDYQASHRWLTRRIDPAEWAPLLGRLKAPLGVHAVLGNHDWWDDWQAHLRRRGPTIGRRALERAGIPVYENDAVRLTKNGHSFWIAGLGDQVAFRTGRDGRRWLFQGVDDLPGTLARITDDAPVILMAHEPDVFARMSPRVALTVCGHTHGGQIRVLGWSPWVPSEFGSRYAYGHIVEGGRDLIVSGGLGCSLYPVRFGVPPEIVEIEIG
jgi:predicted MPP superfamily phosphohydrolase